MSESTSSVAPASAESTPSAPSAPASSTSSVPSTSLGLSRRNLIIGTAGALVLMGVGGVARATVGSAMPLRPPGGQDEQRFIGTCIRCDRCRGVCPRDVIETCTVEDGIINMRSPKLHFRVATSRAYRRPEDHAEQSAVLADPYNSLLGAGGSNFCDFCMLCVKNCPTGALKSFDPNHQWIGEAVVDPQFCIAFEKMGGCRKCVDYCPFGAISLDDNRRPVVALEKCNGCGICENICPSSTYRTFRGGSKRGINIVSTEQGRPQ